MTLFIIAYLGGALTILSPCILPVLPFVFARFDQPFVKSGLPLLLGMAIAFAAVATLAAVGGGWAVQANQLGRDVAIALLALFGVALLFPEIADRVMRPLVAMGSRLLKSADDARAKRLPFLSSFLLGVATGFLWAPCAGPILGLVLTGAALGGASVETSLLLLAYAVGAGTSLACALLIGGGLFRAMRRSLGVGDWIRRGLGLAVLAGVGAIALGLDTGPLTRISLAGTSSIEQSLIDRFHLDQQAGDARRSAVVTGDSNVMMSGSNAMMAGSGMMMASGAGGPAKKSLHVEGQLPSLAGAVEWLNSAPLTAEALRGKVVLVDFWTYSCINCLRSLPFVRAWAEKYRDNGLVVIGVHAPEFAFEKNIDNVRAQVRDLNVTYPVAIDNDYAIWRAFGNRFWPAHYFIDAKGAIRHHHFGEGDYDESEKIIQQLLAEAGAGNVPSDIVSVTAQGAEAAADSKDEQSPETYVGFRRAENFASPGGVAPDARHPYALPVRLDLNQWALAGDWTIGSEAAVSHEAGGRIVFRFHARDLHLVLGPSANGQAVRFRVLMDGKPPGASHGEDTDAQGLGVVNAQRLYQLIRQDGPVTDRQFEIEFSDPGVQAFAFTFG